jgi:hypothetical protein
LFADFNLMGMDAAKIVSLAINGLTQRILDPIDYSQALRPHFEKTGVNQIRLGAGGGSVIFSFTLLGIRQ